MNRRQLFLSSAKGALAAALGAVGFRTAARAQSAMAVQFPDSTVLPTPTPPFKGFIQPNLIDSQPGWPPTVMPPEGAPNVLLILIDDAGFGSNSAFGGVVPTPTARQARQSGPALHADAQHRALLADARGAADRAATITTLATAWSRRARRGYPGYNSITRRRSRMARGAQARTATRPPGSARTTMCRSGKRVRRGRSSSGRSDKATTISTASSAATRASGSRATCSATRRRSTPTTESREWNLDHRDGGRRHRIHQHPDVDRSEAPVVHPLRAGRTHAPHHPTQEWVDKISAMHLFDDGWNAVSERIFENQKKLGVIPANAKLPPWPDFLPKWETLSADEKKLYLRQIDVWAAYMAYSRPRDRPRHRDAARSSACSTTRWSSASAATTA